MNCGVRRRIRYVHFSHSTTTLVPVMPHLEHLFPVLPRLSLVLRSLVVPPISSGDPSSSTRVHVCQSWFDETLEIEMFP